MDEDRKWMSIAEALEIGKIEGRGKFTVGLILGPVGFYIH